MNPLIKKIPLYLAPMEGLTTPALRKAFHSLPGVSAVFTEFIRVSSHPLSKKVLIKSIFPETNSLSFQFSSLLHSIKQNTEIPQTWVQLMGSSIEFMQETASILHQIEGIYGINLNFGCPAPLVYSKGCGAALLQNPTIMVSLVESIQKAGSLPVSAKMRAGIQEGDDFLAIAQALAETKIDHLTLHARTKQQLYTGQADHIKTQLLVKHLNIPVIANGDLCFAQDVLSIQQQTACYGAMLGRAGLCQPFIFWQLACYFENQEKLSIHLHPLFSYYEALYYFYLQEEGSEMGALKNLKAIIRYLGLLKIPMFKIQRLLQSQTVAELFEQFQIQLAGIRIGFDQVYWE